MSDPEEDFAAMFEASLQAKRIEKGQTIEGTVVAIGLDVAFVDVGGKGEATIDVDELKDADGAIEVAVGDRIQAIVVSTSGGLTLSRKLARGAATRQQLEDAFHSGLPVEGRIERAVKGGFEVRIAGQRAFCPISQIDTPRAEPAAHEGRVYAFRIVEFNEGGRNLVVSRRVLIDEEQQAEAERVRQSIVPGAVVTGRVASVRDFGAFIELGGGVQGLLHISEMGWSRVSDTSEVVKAGDEITVKVLQVDDAKQKISLGLKQLTADPWAHVAERYEVGQVKRGRVTRVVEFGAFVELEPGIEALAHASTFESTGRTRQWSASVTPGMEGAFEILSVDAEKKRIGVAPVPEGSARAASAGGETDREHDEGAGGETPEGSRVAAAAQHRPFGRAALTKGTMSMITRRDAVLTATTLLLAFSFVAVARPQTSVMRSTAFDWKDMKVNRTAVGESRPIVRTATATLDELEMHVTTLNANQTSHAPHQHPNEELVIIREGTVEALVQGEWKRLGPGSIVFNAANELHAIRNVGTAPATYHVVNWKSR